MGTGFSKFELPDGRTPDSVPEPCVTLPKATPAEALRLGIKLPWDGKVQRMRPADLTKDLFVAMEAYGVTRLEMTKMFHISNPAFQAMIKKWDIPRGMTGGANRAARAGNMEKAPADPAIHCRPGQTFTARKAELAAEAVIKTEAEMDAELARVEEKLAAIDGDTVSTPDPDPAPELTELIDQIDTPHVATQGELQKFFAPDEDENGLNYQDKHFLGLVEGPSVEEEMALDPDQGQKELEAMAVAAEIEQLQAYVLQAASELGRFPAAGLQIGLLVANKQGQYGDTISSMGPLLKVLYPDGIGHDQYDDLALIVRIMDKIGRITKGNGQGAEDAWGDLAGYALLGQAGRQRKKSA
jgi:hypothetical protein